MLEKSYEELEKGINLRENLSLLRSAVKNSGDRERVLELVGDGHLLIGLLTEDEPKVRKNAALLLGDLGLWQALGSLFAAYNHETKLFVKSSYLNAMGKLDAAEYLEAFKERLAVLTAAPPAENEKKHVYEEIRELETIITGIEGITKHVFTGLSAEQEILLTTNKEQREVTQKETEGMPASVKCNVRLHPLGVLVKTADVVPFTKLRTYRELLFPLKTKGPISQQPKEAAKAIGDSNLIALLKDCHQGNAPFYFRLELKSRMELDKKSSFARQFAAELEQISDRGLINSTRDYEIEIRLAETKDGNLSAFLKLFTLPMKRFSYRKNAISSSIHPATAAMIMELARPYLMEDAQILDPFCGVGTMLIERDICVPAREIYGMDIYGKAIDFARENASLAKERINFIHRDYFDFRHAYPFDEIITNMPVRGRKTREEMNDFYADFFAKSRSILAPGGIVILYSNEEGFVKKQLRLNSDYKLLQEFVIREKDHFSLFVIKIAAARL